MHRHKKCAALAAALACASCTHLETQPTGDMASVAPGASAAQGAQRGLSYALPMVQYDLKITRALEECPTEQRPWPKFTAKVEAVERYVAGERFEIDYEALSSIMKSTTFNVTYHDTGTLKSINATAKDKTGDVLSNVARIGIAVASATMPGVSAVPAATGSIFKSTLGAPVPAPAATEATATLLCTPEASRAIEELKASTNDVKRLTARIPELEAQIKRGTELAALKLLSGADRKRLAAAARDLFQAEDDLRKARARLLAAQQKLSATQDTVWPNAIGSPASYSGVLLPDSKSLEKLWKLFEPPQQGGLEKKELVRCIGTKSKPAIDCLAGLASLNLVLAPVATAPSQVATPDPRLIVKAGDKRWARGVFIREPAEARLVVCLPGAQARQGVCSEGDTMVLQDEIVVAPQFGRLRLLPLTNGPFEDNSLELTVRANGLIEGFKYGQESAASAATGSIATVAEKFEAALEKMEEERRSDEKYARETQAWIRTEAAAIRADELSKLTTQVEQAKKQLEYFKSQAALASAETSMQMEAEQALLDAEVKSLQAQIAKLKAAAELSVLSNPAG